MGYRPPAAKGAGALGAMAAHAVAKPKPNQRKSPGNRGGPKGAQPSKHLGPKYTTAQREKLIGQHIHNYASNPKVHAQALRDLGLSPSQLRAVHRFQVAQTAGIAENPHISGFVGKAAHLANKTLGDLETAAIYSPAGMYRIGEAVATDLAHSVYRNPAKLPKSKTAEIGKQLAKGVAEDVRHPLRHPGNVLLDVAGGVGAVEGAAARVGAAGKALKAGEGVARAVTKKGHEGGSLLHRPNTGTIEYREGNLVTHRPASKRVGVAALQRRRAATAGAGKVGKVLTEERRVTEAADRAPIEALAHRSRRLTTPMQTALRVYNEGKSVGERVGFHQRMLGESSKLSPGRVLHRQKILLLKASDRYLVHDEHGVPTLKPISAAASKREAQALARLHDAQASLERVARTREERLAAIGKLGEGRIESRLHSPGRVIAGARMETQKEATRARGVSSRRARTEQIREYPARSKTVTRPRTEAEARAFIADMDARYEKIVATMADAEVKPKGVVGKRNLQNVTLARRGRPLKPTLTAEARLHAERKLQTLMRTSKHPSIVKMRDQLALADKLRDELGKKGDSIFGESGKSELGAVSETIPGKPRRVHLREQAARRGVKAKPRLVGAADFTGGKARIPYASEVAVRSQGSHPGYRGGKPRELATVTNEYTGGLLKSGNFRDDTARLVAESGLEAQRHTALIRLRDRVIAAAEHAPDHRHTVPVRLDGLKNRPFPANVKAAMRKSEEGVKLSRDEKRLLVEGTQSIRDDIFPTIDPADYAKHKDVVWVDPKILDGLDRQPYRLANAIGERPVAAIDAINNMSKLAILYLKPAYAIPNIAGNAFMNIAQQGPHAMANWWESRSRALVKHLGQDGTAKLDSVMGEGIAGSLSTHEGIGARAVAGAAGAWSKVVDRIFRRAAFLHEAKRLGFDTPEKQRALLMDDAHKADLVEAAQRAKEAIIDYERMGQREKEVVRRIIFFYPWVKGSTRYAGHFLLEHPIQSAAAGNLGEYGKEHTGLGPVPSYLEGSFRVGENKLVNPNAAAVFQTPAQVAQAIHALAHGQVTEAARLGSFATPAVGLALSEIARQDNFGNPISPRTSGGDIAIQSLLQSTPQYTLAKRILQGDKSKRLFPLSPKEAVAQFAIGGVAPKTYNPKVLAGQAKKEQRSLMSPSERVTFDHRTLVTGLQAAYKAKGKTMPAEVRGRLALRYERAKARVKAAGGHKLDSKSSYQADLGVLVKHKWVTPARRKELVKWSETAPADDISNALGYLTRHYFDRDHQLSAIVKWVRDHGHPNLVLPPLP